MPLLRPLPAQSPGNTSLSLRYTANRLPLKPSPPATLLPPAASTLLMLVLLVVVLVVPLSTTTPSSSVLLLLPSASASAAELLVPSQDTDGPDTLSQHGVPSGGAGCQKD